MSNRLDCLFLAVFLLLGFFRTIYLLHLPYGTLLCL